jgi:hypothetical protein
VAFPGEAQPPPLSFSANNPSFYRAHISSLKKAASLRHDRDLFLGSPLGPTLPPALILLGVRSCPMSLAPGYCLHPLRRSTSAMFCGILCSRSDPRVFFDPTLPPAMSFSRRPIKFPLCDIRSVLRSLGLCWPSLVAGVLYLQAIVQVCGSGGCSIAGVWV